MSSEREVIQNKDYTRTIQVDEPLFLYLDEITKMNDCRVQNRKLEGYVYEPGSPAEIMIKFLFTFSVKLFAKFQNVGEEPAPGIQQYIFQFGEEENEEKYRLMTAMEDFIEGLPDDEPLKKLVSQVFFCHQLADYLFGLTKPILQGKMYDEAASDFGLGIASIAMVVSECHNSGNEGVKNIIRRLERY